MSGLKIPEFTILPDHSSSRAGGAEVDYFDLENRLGPMLDVVRHRDTEMPLSMAIYGGVGAGKSTALDWLARNLEQWNRIPEIERCGHPQAIPIRFSARNCTGPASVARKMWADILLQSMTYLDDRSTQQRIRHVKQVAGSCSGILGRDLLLGLECIARRWGALETLRATAVDSRSVPLNEGSCFDGCHEVIGEWISERGGYATIRIIVFADDLDHVSPDVMMAAFEAVSMQVRNPHIGFIAAFDAHIARTLVKQHFTRHEFGDMQCRHYLSKIFHVECDIEPNHQQIQRYYNAQFKLLDARSGQRLSMYSAAGFRECIDTAIIHLSSGNPRKIKMLLNSALMKGLSGLRAAEKEGLPSDSASLVFMQHVQLFLLQRWLSYFSVGSSAIYREDVVEWFEYLSDAAQAPDADYRWVTSQFDNETTPAPPGVGWHMIHEWVWNLLKIPFSKSMASHCCNEGGIMLEPVSVLQPFSNVGLQSLSSGLRDCLAATLEKASAELSDEDVLRITDLDLSGLQFTDADIRFLGTLENLRRLDLHNSSIRDLEALAGLHQLKSLNLTCTPIKDIIPIGQLTGLELLDLSFTAVSDLTPLTQCRELVSLVLFGAPVSDLAPLKELGRLSRINLSRTFVTDEQIGILESLAALKTVFLRDTKVTPGRVSLLNKAFEFGLKIEQ